MRSSTLKVLRQLSKCGLEEDRHKFMQLASIRQPGRHGSSQLDGASNLFYYLFEDYSAAFGILNMSKTALDEIVSCTLSLLFKEALLTMNRADAFSAQL